MRRDKKRERDIARQRIERLLSLADEIYMRDKELAISYGELARRISMRYRVRIPRKWSWRYCRNCKKFLYPGINMRVRIRSRRMPHIVMMCEECGGLNRHPY